MNCMCSPMTRILPTYGANLAHFTRQPRQDQYNRTKESAETTESRRHHGNRRMGDRRQNDRRAQGRRATDRMARTDAQVWLTADFSAHLIGQAYEAPADAKRAASAYTNSMKPVQSRRGGLI